jgi:hypothetical protein
MKNYLLLMSIAALLSCNDNSDTATNAPDSSHHNHEINTDNNTAKLKIQ